MNPPPRPVRRLLMTPLAWGGSLILVAISPVLLPISVLLDVIDRHSWRFTRLLGLGVAF